MSPVQMVITLISRSESLQTLPTDMRPTPYTRHMIAPLRLLNRGLAFRAVLNSKPLFRLLQGRIPP